jgi:hypothetical protein
MRWTPRLPARSSRVARSPRFHRLCAARPVLELVVSVGVPTRNMIAADRNANKAAELLLQFEPGLTRLVMG